MNHTSAADRCRGVLVGLAAGDRNGGPIRMAVRLAESLLDCGGFNAADILERYLQWLRQVYPRLEATRYRHVERTEGLDRRHPAKREADACR